MEIVDFDKSRGERVAHRKRNAGSQMNRNDASPPYAYRVQALAADTLGAFRPVLPA